MKKYITVGVLLGSSCSYSYWKLKGPFVTNLYLSNGYEIKDTLTHAYNHPFLYDKHTNYFLTAGEANPKKTLYYTDNNWTLQENKKDDQFEFLKGNFEYNIPFLNECHKKYNNYTRNRDYLARVRDSGPCLGKVLLEKKNKHFLKEDILYLFDRINRKMPWHCFTHTESIFNFNISLFSNDTYPIKFNEYITVNEEIKIINSPNKVLLTNGKKNVDFQETLIDYYSGQKIFKQFAEGLEIFHEKISQKKEILFTTKEKADYLFFPLSRISLANPKQIYLLQNSKILAVWGILSEPNNTPENFYTDPEPEKYNIVFGLAKDNATGRLFHWITNLQNDIKVLLSLNSYAKTKSKTNNTIEDKQLSDSPEVINDKTGGN